MGVVARARQTPSIVRAVCLLTDQVGTAVYIRDNKNGYYKVARCNPASLAKMPSIGVIVKKWDFTQALVQFSGVVEGVYTGLIPNQTYWVGSSGDLAAAPPPIDGTTLESYSQAIGVALDESVLLLRPDPMMVIRRS